MKKIRFLVCFVCTAAFLLCTGGLQAAAAEKQTAYNSPYVTFSPDGKAWTTNAGDRNYQWYDSGTRVSTGIKSAIRSLQTGEHYYRTERQGEVPVGFWKVEHRSAQCIHNKYPQKDDYYHGIAFGRKKCGKYYYSGWNAYCADCGDSLTNMLMYMSREAVESIDYLCLGEKEELAYYYLCPFCSNLEQGAPLASHQCNAISPNQYKVRYQPNTGGESYGGHMPDSIHMYDNAEEYEGKKVTPVTHLTKNTYTRTGYEFTGWNTEADGSGTFYEDGAEILNLTSADCNRRSAQTEGETGIVTFYAQWRRSSSTLVIDANGGAYQGQPVLRVTQDYSGRYIVEKQDVTAPAGYTVSFETNGGAAVSPVRGTRYFTEWSMVQPFMGKFQEDTYFFMAPDGTADTLRANYAHDLVTLPDTSRPGSSFGGWYYDREFTKPAGRPGDTLIPSGDITLYAQWVELTLKAEENYGVKGGRGAVDLSWKQPDGKDKTYLLYQGRDGKSWTKIHAADDVGSERQVRETFTCTESTGNWTVPYAGLYTLSAEGARGGNYGKFSGGKGGRVTARVWLQKGEVITYTAGGRNGFNGGGAGSVYSPGGGYSILSTNLKGTILIGGGGGGATALGNGGAGGSEAGVAGSGNTAGTAGQSGGAGGGGGYRGGAAGAVLTHRHEEAVCGFHAHTGDSRAGGGCYGKRVVTGSHVVTWEDPLCCSSCQEGPLAHYPGNPYGACGSFNSHWERTEEEYRFEINCGIPEGYHCGLQQGQVMSAYPAYGGSSYINTSAVYSYTNEAGVGTGNGIISIVSESIGYQETRELAGVTAADCAAPDGIAENSVTRKALDEGRVEVTWRQPEDRGTVYYHKAESCLRGSTALLCTSNITENTLTSGIKGYYWLLDGRENTAVNENNGAFVSGRSVTVTAGAEPRYLHLAAVDIAGNVGTALHIRIDEKEVPWKLYTRQLSIEEGDNVYSGAGEKTWYVKADGSTPFTLTHKAYLNGTASNDYQPNYTVFETLAEGQRARSILFTPSHAVTEGEIRTDASGLSYTVEGTTLLDRYPYSYTVRSERNRSLESVQKFTLSGETSGMHIEVLPAAGADKKGMEAVYSDPDADRKNGITLIPDGDAPVITGMEALEKDGLIDRNNGKVFLNITAQDTLSGVREFYVRIYNTDNAVEEIYQGDENGSIRLEITKDEPIFSGDFTITAYASDYVGNEREISCSTTEFALDTGVERILEPHDPVFKCGESGILTVTTRGYADRIEIEFPEEFVQLNPDMNRTCDYTAAPQYKQEERIQFMVPLYAPSNKSFTITVRAYKGDRQLEKYPSISVIAVEGSVLEDFRTRLR